MNRDYPAGIFIGALVTLWVVAVTVDFLREFSREFAEADAEGVYTVEWGLLAAGTVLIVLMLALILFGLLMQLWRTLRRSTR